MKLKRMVSILLAAVMLFAMAPVSFAGSTMGTAESVTSGTAKTVKMKAETDYWYKFAASAGQFITVSGIDPEGSLSMRLWDKQENRLNFDWYGDTDDRCAMAETAGTYYLEIQSYAAQTVTFTVTLTDNDTYEPNNTMETAVAVEPGVEYAVVGNEDDDDWFVVEAQPGQIVMVERSENFSADFFGSNGEWIEEHRSGNLGWCFAPADGAVYMNVYNSNNSNVPWIAPGTFTVTVIDNDAFENNNTESAAYELTSGVPAEFQLGYGDDDWFAVDMKAGQDVKLELGGFNHATRGYYAFGLDSTSNGYVADTIQVNGNRTYYYHAAEDGLFTFGVCDYYDSVNGTSRSTETFTVTATVLEGDGNEPNDSLEDAKRLPIGTDGTFSMGGKGDEDWFTFEAALDEGQTSKLYTLNLLDLNSDYSDEFFYDLYAPNGDQIMSAMKVNYRHINVLACEQEGLYALRLYRESTTAPRSTLRIRVDEGGADPYEPNDTWLTAAEVQDGQPVQYILSNTADEDWFRIRVPRANMTLSMDFDSDQRWYLYDAGTLEEFGPGTEYSSQYLSYGYGSYYYRFADPGVYYVRTYAQTSQVSQDLRTMVLTLEDARDNEPNDTWKTATTIYEGVPMAFDLSASNDYDWFKFEVPEGVDELRISGGSGYYEKFLYRGSDFETAGDKADYITYSGGDITLDDPAADTYYVKCSNGRRMDQTVTFYLTRKGELPAQTMEEAEPITEGEWLEDIYGGWYALGRLKAGEELRVYGDNLNYVGLYDEAGEQVDYYNIYNSQHTAISVPADGEYWLKVAPDKTYTEDNDYKPYRLLVDVADRELAEGETFVLEGPDTVTVEVGESVDIDLRLAPYGAKYGYSGSVFDWNSPADSAIASVSTYSGRGICVTGKAVGTTTVKFWVYRNSSTCYKTVTVNVVESLEGVPAQSVTVGNAPAELALGASAQLKAVLTPADSTDGITWTSSDAKVLYVSAAGKVTAVGDGTATITATAASGASASVTITVTDAPAKPEVTSLTLDRYDMTLYMGEAGGKLTATVAPADSTAVIGWVSSNLKAATVDQEGNITPVGPGVTVVTASAGDYRASCVVTVQPDRVNVESIAFDTAVLELPMGGESTLRPVFTPSDATVQSVTWVSSDPNVVTVSRTGIVHAIMGGEATVTATTLDGGKQASIVIRVIAAPQLGDINADGWVDAADAMITLQVAVGKVELDEVQFEAADVNRDGWVDAADAVRILRFDAGLIDSLN